jgi:hypothetical protein
MDVECIWIEIAAAAMEELVCREILMVGDTDTWGLFLVPRVA